MATYEGAIIELQSIAEYGQCIGACAEHNSVTTPGTCVGASFNSQSDNKAGDCTLWSDVSSIIAGEDKGSKFSWPNNFEYLLVSQLYSPSLEDVVPLC